MRLILRTAFGLSLALALTAFGPITAAAGETGPVLVELYTSQGCSSCPPADALLGKLAHKDGVIALSFHVDYWDYIGWKDPFAKPAHSKRQRAYAKIFSRTFIYTPQMVIHGRSESSGADAETVMRRISDAAKLPAVPLKLFRADSGELVVSIPADDQSAGAAVWLVIYDSHQTTKVQRGENRGRTVDNFNIVMGLEKIGEWHGERVEITLTADQIEEATAKGADGCAVFLQAEQPGPVLGAASIALAATK